MRFLVFKMRFAYISLSQPYLKSQESDKTKCALSNCRTANNNILQIKMANICMTWCRRHSFSFYFSLICRHSSRAIVLCKRFQLDYDSIWCVSFGLEHGSPFFAIYQSFRHFSTVVVSFIASSKRCFFLSFLPFLLSVFLNT